MSKTTKAADPRDTGKPAAAIAAHEKRREIKEIKSKLQNLSPIAQAEAVSGVAAKQVGKQFTGFVDFLREQSVVGLAIGLVIGTQVKTVVDSLVLNIITPFTGLFLPGSGSLDKKAVSISVGAKTATVTYGSFLLALLNFVIVMAVLYFIFKGLKLDKIFAKKDDDKDKKDAKKKKGK